MKKLSWLVSSAVVFAAVIATPNDAAACRLGIGDRVWQDNNGNGIQDNGEPGINGVRVTISPGFYANPLDPNSLVTSVMTADGPSGFGAGYYLFNGVECDIDYTIAVDLSTLPSGYQPSVIGAGADSAVDSDNPAGTVVNLPVTGFDYTNPTIDFGFTAPVVCEASIGNFVFNDANNNGIQDSGELGVSGAVVSLSGVATGSFTTGSDGQYFFGNLCAGAYTVSVSAPLGFQASQANQGSNDSLDSDGLGTNNSASVTLGSNENNDTIDFGFWKTPTTGPGTGTPGYWKNHAEAWPVDSIVIGGVVYTKEQALFWMGQPDGDKTITMFRSLVSAKLNVLIGNDSSCIASYIASADAWMAANGPVGSQVKARTAAWKAGESLYYELDAYNNGDRCAPHRE